MLYCWGRSDRNDYWSVIYPSSSINVASSATRGTPAAINVKKESNCAGIRLQCPISGNGALLITCEGDSTRLPLTLQDADNSDFTGLMKIHGYNVSGMQVVNVDGASVLGGNPATFQQ